MTVGDEDDIPDALAAWYEDSFSQPSLHVPAPLALGTGLSAGSDAEDASEGIAEHVCKEAKRATRSWRDEEEFAADAPSGRHCCTVSCEVVLRPSAHEAARRHVLGSSASQQEKCAVGASPERPSCTEACGPASVTADAPLHDLVLVDTVAERSHAAANLSGCKADLGAVLASACLEVETANFAFPLVPKNGDYFDADEHSSSFATSEGEMGPNGSKAHPCTARGLSKRERSILRACSRFPQRAAYQFCVFERRRWLQQGWVFRSADLEGQLDEVLSEVTKSRGHDSRAEE